MSPMLFTLILTIMVATGHLSSILDLNQVEFQCYPKCPHSTRCDPSIGACTCTRAYPIFTGPGQPCLARKSLGDQCIYSSQCNHTEHAICISNFSRRNQLVELKDVPRHFMRFRNLDMIKQPEKYLSRNATGRCECGPGYWANKKTGRCEAGRLEGFQCTESSQCPDPNSHCDQYKRRCICDLGHVYNRQQDRCILSLAMLGVFCKSDLDCQVRGEDMQCFLGRCTCRENYRYDQERGCVSICPQGYSWIDFPIKSCEKSQNSYSSFGGKESKREWHQFTPKMLILFMTVSIMIFMMKNRRSIFPTINHLNLDNSRNWHLFAAPGMSSYEMGRPSYRRRSRTQPVPAVHVRINLAEAVIDGERVVMPLNRRPSMCSNSSLPRYEAIQDIVEGEAIMERPPAYDDLPTYEEAISSMGKEPEPITNIDQQPPSEKIDGQCASNVYTPGVEPKPPEM